MCNSLLSVGMSSTWGRIVISLGVALIVTLFLQGSMLAPIHAFSQPIHEVQPVPPALILSHTGQGEAAPLSTTHEFAPR